MMEIIPAKLQEEIDAFKQGVSKEHPDKYIKLTSVDDKDSIDAAVELAYIDTQRTMRGISNPKNIEKKAAKDKALTEIKDELSRYLHGECPDSDTFETEHKILCKIWCDAFKDNDNNGNDNIFGNYGKAQKIINMAFKYLYCCDDAREGGKYHDHFKYCHMPLDSFTLTWFRRDVKSAIIVDNKKKTINDDYKWSKIKEKEYDTIHEEIKAYINKAKYTLSPLELEFIVWPEIQKHLSAEDLLFGLVNDLYFHGYLSEEDYSSKEKMKKRITEMPLDEKYGRITKLLSEMQLIEKGYIPNAYFD